ncbi:MAG TPA: extracellular solute-binding protein, partial [Mesotoga sp.]|nr:extracellular solute-binding protein [Mesotoga sp.]
KVKKFFFVAFLVIFLVVTASARLVYWHTQEEESRQQVIAQIMESFEIETGIKVEVVAIEENEMFSRLAAAAAAGTLPDVIEAGAETILGLGADGLLDTAIPTRFISNAGDFYTGATRFVITPAGNEYFAIPYHGWVQGIWYRKDWFDAAGLEAPTTWESIMTAAKYFHKPQDGMYGIVLGKSNDAYAEQVFTIFALSNGARIFDKDGNVIINSPQMKEVLQYYKDLGAYSAPGHTYWKQARELYLAAKTPMFFYSTYVMDDLALAEIQTTIISEFDPNMVKNTEFAPFMSNSRSSSFGQVISLAVTKTSQNKLDVLKFLDFMFKPENYIKYIHMAPGGMLPTRSSIAESEAFMNDPKGIYKSYGAEKIKSIIYGLENIEKFGYVEGRVFPEMGKISGAFTIGNGIVMMFDNNATPDEVLTFWRDDIRKLIGR